MAKSKSAPDDRPLGDLIGEVVRDAEALLGQQLDLLRAEVRQELRQAGGAVVSMGTGAALVATGGLLSALMVVHGLHRASRLPLWGCYGLVGGTLGAIGVGLLAAGGRQAADVSLLPPPQTAEALRENLAWLQDQATPDAT